jgi:tRNA A37 threonylcarbamoyladenosine dehydratase
MVMQESVESPQVSLDSLGSNVDDQYDRRFGGTSKIYGEKAFSQFEHAHVMVIGIGGVGSWAVEALARSGVGEITLVDMDVLVASNVNRQLPALTETFGHDKIRAMAERARGINPRIKVNLIDDFLTIENVTTLLANKPNVVLDCIDDVKAKIALIWHCRFNKITLIVSGGAGGKVDPLKVRVADLSQTEQDPMLAKIRRELRTHGMCKKPKEKFGITCVYSIDNPYVPDASCNTGGLQCGGYGSAVTVTAMFGMVAAAEVLKRLGR